MSLPGADELFRTTGGMALQSSSPRRQANGEPRVPAPAGESDPLAEGAADPSTTSSAPASSSSSEEHSAADADAAESRSRGAEAGQGAAKARRPQEAGGAAGAAAVAPAGQTRRRGRGANRRPSGRERHDEKITVYVSAEELMDLEHARLVLRGEHGLAVDRGRIVREAVAVVLADLEQRGDASILVRRLRGR
ncbi:hypothetical protein OG883_19885 [Streptomyces sp. NBC_01142]|uniref:hypothetical protein n=1 Tax=Streptomyces sp. NBC_01142 TaxID=2975865 RepID=UPI002259B7D6|nr:hypothetical protein [Streptomyces sp. NBC_01142]MCX4822107.1 hypothetical protein [Streptomyces sp. NBC_01142]